MTKEQLAKANDLVWDIDQLILDLEDLKANGLEPKKMNKYLEIDWIRDMLTHAIIKATEERLAEKKRELEAL